MEFLPELRSGYERKERGMSDLISRQDAIEALDQDVMGGLNYRRILRLLPSADRPKWIPCSKRLPENGEKVLCQTITKKGQINMVIGFYDFERWCCGMNSNVIAWMPLPEAYREDGEEE